MDYGSARGREAGLIRSFYVDRSRTKRSSPYSLSREMCTLRPFLKVFKMSVQRRATYATLMLVLQRASRGAADRLIVFAALYLYLSLERLALVRVPHASCRRDGLWSSACCIVGLCCTHRHVQGSSRCVVWRGFCARVPHVSLCRRDGLWGGCAMNWR